MANKTSNLVTRIKDIKYEKELFDAHLTDSPVDQLFSIKGGIPKATNWMVVGDPGVGKSTVTLDIISNAKKNGSKVLFISAEMNQIDLYLYVERYPKFADIDIFFPQTPISQVTIVFFIGDIEVHVGFVGSDVPVKLTFGLVWTRTAMCVSEIIVFAVVLKLTICPDLYRLTIEPPVEEIKMVGSLVHPK